MSFEDDDEDAPGGSGYRNIRDIFMDGAAEIPPGAMVGMKLFTLHDAMMAIEVNDPRMDSGFPRPEFPKKAFDPLRLLLPEEICWIMDRMFAAEMFWHAGNSFSQSVFTCLYVHEIGPDRLWEGNRTRAEILSMPQDPLRPPELITIVLKAAVFGLLKSCDLACRELFKGHVNEMEDFNAEKADRYICELISELEVVAMLDAAKRWLLSNEAGNITWRAELISRIELRRVILLCLAYRLPDDTALFKRAMRNAKGLLEDIRKFAKPNPAEGSPAYETIDPSIHSRLLNVMPLKFIPLPEVEEAWDQYAGFIAGMREVYLMCQSPSILDIKDILELRSYQPPTPNRTGLVRSYGKSSLWYTRADPWSDELFSGMANVIPSNAFHIERLPSVLIHLLPPAYFRGIIEKMTIEYLGSFFSNRPRQRRILCNWMAEYAILPIQLKEFSKTIQAGLERMEVDKANIPRPSSWSSWLSSSTPPPLPQRPPHQRPTTLGDLHRIYLGVGALRLMGGCHIVLSGLELDLYSPQELPFVYWYGASIFRALEKTLGALREECQECQYQPQYWNQDRNQDRDQNAQFAATYLASEMTWASIMVQAFQAACTTCILASRGGRKEDPVREEINLRRRFKWAFEGFQGLHDPMSVSNLDDEQMYRGDPCTPLLRDWHAFRTQLEMKSDDAHLKECIALHGQLNEALLAHIQAMQHQGDESSTNNLSNGLIAHSTHSIHSSTLATLMTMMSDEETIERVPAVRERARLLKLNAVIDLREVAASTMQTLTLVLDAKNGLDANTGTGGAEGGRDTNGDLRSDASDTSATGDTFASTATSISSSGGLGITEITETSGGAPFLKAAGKCGRWFHLWRVAQ